jgi:hypothetical protein
MKTCLILTLASAAAERTPSTWLFSTVIRRWRSASSKTDQCYGRYHPWARKATGCRHLWLSAPVVEALMPVVELDGSSVKTDWKLQGAARPEEGTTHAAIHQRRSTAGATFCLAGTARSSTGWKLQTNPAAQLR